MGVGYKIIILIVRFKTAVVFDTLAKTNDIILPSQPS